MNHNVFWVLEMKIKPGKLPDFKVLMNEMVNTVEASEPNTTNYESSFSEDKPVYPPYTVPLPPISLGKAGHALARGFNELGGIGGPLS